MTYLQSSQANVETLVTQSVYSYQPFALFLAYGIALGLGLVSLIAGAVALLSNGVSMDAGFLSVLATTRNSALDELSQGTYLGVRGHPLSRLEEAPVRFGELVGAEQT